MPCNATTVPDGTDLPTFYIENNRLGIRCANINASQVHNKAPFSPPPPPGSPGRVRQPAEPNRGHDQAVPAKYLITPKKLSGRFIQNAHGIIHTDITVHQ